MCIWMEAPLAYFHSDNCRIGSWLLSCFDWWVYSTMPCSWYIIKNFYWHFCPFTCSFFTFSLFCMVPSSADKSVLSLYRISLFSLIVVIFHPLLHLCLLLFLICLQYGVKFYLKLLCRSCIESFLHLILTFHLLCCHCFFKIFLSKSEKIIEGCLDQG